MLFVVFLGVGFLEIKFLVGGFFVVWWFLCGIVLFMMWWLGGFFFLLFLVRVKFNREMEIKNGVIELYWFDVGMFFMLIYRFYVGVCLFSNRL